MKLNKEHTSVRLFYAFYTNMYAYRSKFFFNYYGLKSWGLRILCKFGIESSDDAIPIFLMTVGRGIFPHLRTTSGNTTVI